MGDLANSTEFAMFEAEFRASMKAQWVFTGAVLVLSMQVGFALLETGACRTGNVKTILLKNAADFVASFTCWWVCAAAFADGKDVLGILGTSGFFGVVGDAATAETLFIFKYGFAAAFATITSGASAERITIKAYILITSLCLVLAYAPLAHWVWHPEGWLRKMGFKDFAGGMPVHAAGGMLALVVGVALGPRVGRFNSSTGRPRRLPGHSFTLYALGTWMLLIGWFGFNTVTAVNIGTINGASLAGRVFYSTAAAAVTGALGSACMSIWKLRRTLKIIDPGTFYNGILSGLVAVTPVCGYVSTNAALLFGFAGGCGSAWIGTVLLKRLRLDDPVDAVAVHMFSGVLGTIMLGLFDESKGLFYTGSFHLLGVQILGTVVGLAFTTLVAAVVVTMAHYLIGIRVSAQVELAGCDSELGGNAAYSGHMDDDAELRIATEAVREVMLGQRHTSVNNFISEPNRMTFDSDSESDGGLLSTASESGNLSPLGSTVSDHPIDTADAAPAPDDGRTQNRFVSMLRFRVKGNAGGDHFAGDSNGDHSHTEALRQRQQRRAQKAREAQLRRVAATAVARAHQTWLKYASHELRNPLQGVSLSLDELKYLVSELDLPKREAKPILSQLKAVLKNTSRMTRIVNDVLDASAVVEGNMTVDIGKGSLRAIVRDVQLQFRLLARTQVHAVVGKSVPSSLAIDDLRVRQTLATGLVNALKYTGSGFVLIRVTAVRVPPQKADMSVHSRASLPPGQDNADQQSWISGVSGLESGKEKPAYSNASMPWRAPEEERSRETSSTLVANAAEVAPPHGALRSDDQEKQLQTQPRMSDLASAGENQPVLSHQSSSKAQEDRNLTGSLLRNVEKQSQGPPTETQATSQGEADDVLDGAASLQTEHYSKRSDVEEDTHVLLIEVIDTGNAIDVERACEINAAFAAVEDRPNLHVSAEAGLIAPSGDSHDSGSAGSGSGISNALLGTGEKAASVQGDLGLDAVGRLVARMGGWCRVGPWVATGQSAATRHPSIVDSTMKVWRKHRWEDSEAAKAWKVELAVDSVPTRRASVVEQMGTGSAEQRLRVGKPRPCEQPFRSAASLAPRVSAPQQTSQGIFESLSRLGSRVSKSTNASSMYKSTGTATPVNRGSTQVAMGTRFAVALPCSIAAEEDDEGEDEESDEEKDDNDDGSGNKQASSALAEKPEVPPSPGTQSDNGVSDKVRRFNSSSLHGNGSRAEATGQRDAWPENASTSQNTLDRYPQPLPGVRARRTTPPPHRGGLSSQQDSRESANRESKSTRDMLVMSASDLDATTASFSRPGVTLSRRFEQRSVPAEKIEARALQAQTAGALALVLPDPSNSPSLPGHRSSDGSVGMDMLLKSGSMSNPDTSRTQSRRGNTHQGVGRALPSIRGPPSVHRGQISVGTPRDSSERRGGSRHQTPRSTEGGSALPLRALPQARPGRLRDKQRAAAPLAGVNVVVVDDETLIRKLLGRMLVRAGCDVTAISDGDELSDTLAQLRKQGKQPHIVLLDIVMQRSNGMDICIDLRNAGEAVPIVAATSNASQPERVKYLSVGFNGVLQKPFTASQVLDMIQQKARWSKKAPLVQAR